jgi:16S rRNA (guanine966-N2)-methyltransferase
MLAPEIADADFLDLFAGSGSVGLEALSRGAKKATFVEASVKHIKSLKTNLETILKENITSRSEVVVSDAYRWISRYNGAGFHIAFADPPYALGEEKGYASVLAMLAERGIVRPGGLFVAEMTAVQRAEETPGWELIRDRVYGKTRICIWRKEDEKRS